MLLYTNILCLGQKGSVLKKTWDKGYYSGYEPMTLMVAAKSFKKTLQLATMSGIGEFNTSSDTGWANTEE